MITLKNMDADSIICIQNKVLKYIKLKSDNLKNTNPDYLDCILLIDTSQKLYFFLRNKLERMTRKTINIRFTITDAIVLLSCVNSGDDENEFVLYASVKTIIQLNLQLHNLCELRILH